jgi:hypothetical protein
MLSKHIQDLGTLNPDTTLDVDSLAYALYLHDAQVRGGLVCVQAYFALNVLKR